MSVEFYNEFTKRLGLGQIDLVDDDLRLVLCKAGYVFDADHETLTDIDEAQRVATSAADLESKAWVAEADSYVLTADPVIFPLVAGGSTVTQAVLYRNSATPSERFLIARYFGAPAGFPIVTSGGNITIEFATDRVLSLRREGSSLGITEATLNNTYGNWKYTGVWTNTTPTEVEVPLVTGKNYSLDIDVIVRKADGSLHASWSFDNVQAKNVAGVASLVDYDEGLVDARLNGTTYACELDVDGANLIVRCTGAASSTGTLSVSVREVRA